MLFVILKSIARVGAILFFMTEITRTHILAEGVLYMGLSVLVYYFLFKDLVEYFELL